MNIYSLKIDIKNAQGEVELSPIYEVHSWERAEEVIMNTKALLVDTQKTFSFEVFGMSK
jgi:hypothetical protein